MEDDQGTTASSTSATSSTTTTSPRSHPVSVYSGGERHTVQVIQQALNRPTGSATQYLQQMYAAQQQHIMLQTAALQQQHIGNTQLQSLAALQQASLSGGKQPSSPTGTITQQSSMSQTSMNVSTTPTPAQLISRSQVSSTSSSSIAQQTMLLGSTSPTLTASQAQLYLRAQMEVGRLLQRKLCFSTSYHPQSDGQTEQVNQLIFTPAATATTVHSDIPVTTSSPSCQSSASQIQNVTHRSQTPGPLSGSQKSPPRICAPSHHLAITHNPNGNSSKTIQSDSSVEMVRKRKSPSPESPCGSVTHPSSMQQITPTGSFSSFEPHPLLKHQQIPLHSISPKGPHYRCVQPQHHQQQNQQQQQQHQQQQKTIQSMLQQSIQTSTHQNPPLDASMPTHCIPQHTCTQSPAPDNIASLQCSSVQTHAISLTKSPSQPLSPQQSVVVSPGPTRSPSQSPSIIMHPQSHRVVPSSLQSLQNVQRIISNEVPPVQQQTSSVQPPSPQSPHIGQIQSANVVSLEQQIAPQPHQQQCTLQSPPSLISNPTTMPVTFTASVQPLAQQTMQDEAQQPKKLSPRKIFLHNAFISEEDLPAAEALVQLPFQIIPPPQTVAVNLQVEPSVAVETPVIYQVDEVCEEEMPDVVADEYVRKLRTPTPPTLSPQCVCVRNEEEHPMDCTLPDHVGVLMEAPPAGASVIKSPSDSSCASLPPPPLLLPAVTKSGCTLMPNCIPSTENGPPQAIVKPQILTHVIEGFVIQEGLEPFPVNKSSLLVKRREKERQLIGIAHMESELLDNEKQAEFSTDTDVEDNAGGERKKGQMRKQSLMTVLHGLHQETRTDAVVIAIDGIEEMEREVLKCEFCGQMGHANKFLRSKRFCSISCAKRYTANFPKRCGLHKESKTSQWKRKSEKSLNQCPRLSSGSEGKIRERYLRQLPSQYSSVDGALLATDEDSAPTVMTTRLRRKRERERERKGKRRRKTPENMDLQLHAQGDPSFWTVEEVWAFIQSLPGCHYIADEFRTHEIDGQALLLLREDHLMSAMNIKLGPALKICAQINSLKE